jgi:hypothetical protein
MFGRNLLSMSSGLFFRTLVIAHVTIASHTLEAHSCIYYYIETSNFIMIVKNFLTSCMPVPLPHEIRHTAPVITPVFAAIHAQLYSCSCRPALVAASRYRTWQLCRTVTRQGHRFVSSPKFPGGLWDPSTGYQRLFPRAEVVRAWSRPLSSIYERCLENNAPYFFVSKYLFLDHENYSLWRVTVWLHTLFLYKLSVHFYGTSVCMP